MASRQVNALAYTTLSRSTNPEYRTTPEYVRQDHWWDEKGKLAPLWNAVVPPLVSWVLPPILRSVPHVPVYHDGRAASTVKESLRLLQDGKNLVIFPEIPTGFGEHDTEKINEGWLMMLPMYEKRGLHRT